MATYGSRTLKAKVVEARVGISMSIPKEFIRLLSEITANKRITYRSHRYLLKTIGFQKE